MIHHVAMANLRTSWIAPDVCKFANIAIWKNRSSKRTRFMSTKLEKKRRPVLRFECSSLTDAMFAEAHGPQMKNSTGSLHNPLWPILRTSRASRMGSLLQGPWLEVNLRLLIWCHDSGWIQSRGMIATHFYYQLVVGSPQHGYKLELITASEQFFASPLRTPYFWLDESAAILPLAISSQQPEMDVSLSHGHQWISTEHPVQDVVICGGFSK